MMMISCLLTDSVSCSPTDSALYQ